MNLLPLLLGSVLGLIPHATSLDVFQCDDLAEARNMWQASEGTPEVTCLGKKKIVVSAPFAERPELRRAVIDHDWQADLSAPDSFTLQLQIDHPEAFDHVTLYFRSGDGWYGGTGHLQRTSETQPIDFRKSRFRTEGEPAGWDRIDGIRLAFWQGSEQNAKVVLAQLTSRRSRVAIARPDLSASDGELRTAWLQSQKTDAMLDKLGIQATMLSPEELTNRKRLNDRDIVLLPYSPYLSSEAVDALIEYLENGGRLFVAYQAPDRLLEAMGFRPWKFYRPEDDDPRLAEIRFRPPQGEWNPFPESMRQHSWNIDTAIVGENPEYSARILGWWYDEHGHQTDYPAALISDRGVFLSHILLDDDPRKKLRFLAAAVADRNPLLWGTIAGKRRENLGNVGHFEQLEPLMEFLETSVANQPHLQKTKLRITLANLQQEIEALLQNAREIPSCRDWPVHFQAAQKALPLQKQLEQFYLEAMPSRAGEARAWWNHSGLGAYPGDWERTARMLQAGGFNMVLPNLLWGGRVHYRSEVLPESETFREYGDQVKACLEACRPRGIEVHVWKVHFRLSGAPKEFVEKMRNEDRLQVTIDGEQGEWLCPSHPENRRLELESMLEVARNYDIDGIHFDYIRYPNADSCFCDGCRERFEALGQTVEHWPEDVYRGGSLAEEYNDFRCRQITTLVAEISKAAHRLDSELAVSAAVFGSYPHCRESVAQDWPLWIRKGYLDFVCPMDYTESDTSFENMVSDQLERVNGRIPVYPGIGATASRSRLTADRVAGQIHLARKLGAPGFTIFNLSRESAEELIEPLAVGTTLDPPGLPHREKKQKK